MPKQRYTSFAWTVLGINLLVILWGAFVRATGSGAGCGSHWPLCNGEVVPNSPSFETFVELTHRVTSGIAFLLVAVLLVWGCRLYPKGHRVRGAAWWSMIFMVGEAAVGAALVLLELVGQNDSITRAWVMALHLVNTFLLVGALTLLAWFAGGGSRLVPKTRPKTYRLAMILVVASLILGASGAVAALGDTLYTPTDLGTELREEFSGSAPLLKQLRILHPLIAVLTSLGIFHFVGRIRSTRGIPAEARRWAGYLNLSVVTQLGLGTLNILLLAPVWLQLVHLLLADVVWILLVLTAASALADDSEPAASAA